MSFNKIQKDNLQNTPFIKENINDQFIQLQNKYIEFIKFYEEIAEYEKKLSGLDRKQYDKIKDDV
jgi:hypothetical protein